jgi:hypothetical protein
MNDGFRDHDDARLPEANHVERWRLILEGAW